MTKSKISKKAGCDFDLILEDDVTGSVEDVIVEIRTRCKHQQLIRHVIIRQEVTLLQTLYSSEETKERRSKTNSEQTEERRRLITITSKTNRYEGFSKLCTALRKLIRDEGL